MSAANNNEISWVHDIASSWDGRVVAVAIDDHRARLLDVRARSVVGEVDTLWSLGGQRLAVTSDGAYVVGGAWDWGVACTQVSTGEEEWRRSDLDGIQYITMSATHDCVYCIVQDRGAFVLNLQTGEDIRRMRGVEHVAVSPFAPLVLVSAGSGTVELQSPDGERIAELGKSQQGYMSAAFSRRYVMIANAGGSIRCYSVKTGEAIWKARPPRGWYTLEAGYDERDRLFQIVLRSRDNGDEYVLHRVAQDTGSLVAEVPIPDATTTQYCLKGRLLMTGDGPLVDTRTGKFRHTFDFHRARI